MFSLAGHCELLLLLCFIASWILSCGECDVISLYVMYFSVNGSVCLVCWVWLLFCCYFACDPSVYLSVPSIGFVYVFVCQKLSPHLRV